MRKLLLPILLPLTALAADRDWPVVAGGPESNRYSPLKQIHRGNVSKLKQAWTFDTGDASQGSEMQCSPIVVRGVMYVTSPKLRVLALDAATGKQIWAFDPNPPGGVPGKFRNRGLVFWESPDKRESRIYFSWRNWLYSLDAKTGLPAASFGAAGRVDLREGLGRDPKTLTITSTTPGVIHRDLLILGGLVPESLPSTPGDIRAFDVRTGAIRWRFNTIPHPGEPGYETWPPDAYKRSGGANSWAGFALDAKRDLVFVPTGSAAFDFYGADRAGDNLFANCLLALRASTGERVWHFQFVRHDVWDRDLPSPPSLVTVKRDGRSIAAVAQITKSGHVWVFDRETGKSLFPFEERPIGASPVEGEKMAKTSPLPLKPEAFARQQVTEDMLTRRTPEGQRIVASRFKTIRSGPQFTAPSEEGTIVFPGFDGGGEWGGPAFDPETGLYYINSNEMPWILRLVPRPATRNRESGKTLYVQRCASCHREDLGGSPPEFPSLKGIGSTRTTEHVDQIIRQGQGRMPGFAFLRNEAIGLITRYLMTGDDRASDHRDAPAPGDLKYTIDGYNKFLDPDGYPAIMPPWGTLNAINLHTGDYAWKIPFGEYPELVAKGMKDTGSENYGGPVVTAGGLLFIGATNFDKKFRAFDKATGKLLWETTLPAGGNATPATYTVKGKQYVVIGAGGGKSGAPSGGSYVAFALE